MATSKVGAKKSLFKKPAWASTSTTTNDNEPIFGQAHLYEDILADERSRRERHAAKQKERAEKERAKEQERESKRRRISKEYGDSDHGSDSDVKSTKSISVSSQNSRTSTVARQEQEESRVLRSTPQKQTNNVVDTPKPATAVQTRSQKGRYEQTEPTVVLDGDDLTPSTIQDEDDELYDAPKEKPSRLLQKPKEPESESESEDEEDEYLRELKAKARREARFKQSGMSLGRARTPGSPTTQNSANIRSPSDAPAMSPSGLAECLNTRATSTPAGEDEAEVKIWIKTIIPGAKEVIVNRRVGQPLEKVREFWIKRNALEPAIADKVFFIWNGTRLYNSTTMRGIIERLKKTHPTKNGSDPSNGQIIIEAVTDEIFDYRQKQRERRLAETEDQTGGRDPTDDEQNTAQDDTAGDEDDTPAPQPQKSGIVIKLQAQGLEEMPLRVRPHTSVGKILTAFCHMRNIDPDKQKWLSFDGDKLDEDATVEDVGFEHDDTVEVHLR